MNIEQIKSVINDSVHTYQEKKHSIGTFYLPLNTDYSLVKQIAETDHPGWHFELQDDFSEKDMWAFYNPKDTH